MSRDVGWIVVEMDGEPTAVVDWLGSAVGRERAVDLLAAYGASDAEADYRLARVVIEDDE